MLATAHKAAGARLCRAFALALLSLPAWGADFDSPLRSIAWAAMSDGARVAAVIGCVFIPAVVLCALAAGGRKERRLGLALFGVLALLWGTYARLAGSVWYVRPAEGTYGTSDGTSYANAFDGFADVVWGVGNVDSGDVLTLCSSEAQSFDVTSIDGGQFMLTIEAAGPVIEGDCSAQGGQSRAVLDGEGTQDYGIFCNTAALCLGTTIRNVAIRNFDRAGVYVRSDLSPTSTSNVTIDKVSCQDVIGLAANFPTCYQIFGGGATLTNVTSLRTTDDGIHIEGDNALVTDWDIRYPAWQASTELGDCVQIALQTDNARVRRGFCDKSNYSSKQAVAFTGADVSDDNAEISDVVAVFPLTGNTTWQSKVLYSDTPGTVFERNLTTGGFVGIWMIGAGQTARSNIVIRPESAGIQATSVVTSGTHNIVNNSVSGANRCLDLNGGASVTINAYNNALVNCATGIQKGGSSTVNHGSNAGFNLAANVNGCCSPLAITADPQFIGGPDPRTAEGFRLSASSPLAGAGTDLGDEIADFFGDYMYNGKWDIGAFRRDSCYRRSRDGKLDMARTRAQVVSRCRGIPGRYPEGL